MDITEDILAFRDAARSVWNLHLRPRAEGPNPYGAWEDWEEICTFLFRGMVARRLGIDVLPGNRLDVFFHSMRVTTCLRGSDLLVNRSVSPSAYWDFDFRGHADRLCMAWGWFFDFGDLGHVDLEYHHVLIVGGEDASDVAGRRALVPVRHSRVIFDSAADASA